MDKQALTKQIELFDNSLQIFKIADGYLNSAKENAENLIENINFAIRANEETKKAFANICIDLKQL